MANSFSGSPEVGGRSTDRKRAAEVRNDRRPRTEDLGFHGNEHDDPVAPGKGLLEGVLDDLSNTIQGSLAGTSGDDRVTSPQERAGRRPPADDRLRPAPKPPSEEEVPPIVPGDPNNFGARGRRRGTRDDVSVSPVLRRGLLGV